MIRVTRLDRTPVVVNALLIATIESTPDTIITLTTNRKVVVKEPADTVIKRTVQYLRRLNGLPTTVAGAVGDDADPVADAASQHASS